MDTRIFVHKKEQFQVESESLASELRQSLSLKEDFGLTKYNLYDIFNADENALQLFWKNGHKKLSLKSKVELAADLVNEIIERYHKTL